MKHGVKRRNYNVCHAHIVRTRHKHLLNRGEIPMSLSTLGTTKDGIAACPNVTSRMFTQIK